MKQFDDEYSKFIKKADKAIKKADILFSDQGVEFENLIVLERDLQNSIIELGNSSELFGSFISYIKDDLGNILRAKPYFRIKEKEFNSKISKFFKDGEADKLKLCNGNYMLLAFLVRKIDDKNIINKFEEYKKLRERTIEALLPLAINKAINFYKKTKSTSLSSLDLINIATIGLATGVDKYCGAYTRVFRSVCIGQMVRVLIENNNHSLTKLPSGDKKILYRINILRYRKGIKDINEVFEKLNNSYNKDKLDGKRTPRLPISVEKIRDLIMSTDLSSEDSNVDINKKQSSVNLYGFSYNMEEKYQEKEEIRELSKSLKNLEIKEKKVIRLKGVDL